MKVQVNNKEVETTASTLAQLATQLQLPENGVAIAVNNRMIPRPQWDGFGLQENDNLIVIKAACNLSPIKQRITPIWNRRAWLSKGAVNGSNCA